jgi:hypothetical protein
MLNRSEFPRPEYPRPDFQRGRVEGLDWLNLNGPWEFCFDGGRVGVEERWFEPGAGSWSEQIIVPFCWESLAAWGQGDSAGNDNYYATRVFLDPATVDRSNHRAAPRYEVGWYRRTVRIPRDTPAWAGKRVILKVGAADFHTQAWCNGRALGQHEGGYTPFEFDLTDALDADGTGSLVFRVEDPMDNAQQPVGKQWQWYTTTSGIWQTVFIEPRSTSHLRPFRVQTDTEAQTVTFAIPCANAQPGDEVRIRVHPPEGHPPGEYDLPVQGDIASGTLAIGPMVLWSHHHPNLYYADLQLYRAGRIIDEVHTYFGMRKISALLGSSADDPAALCLNDRPLYLRGALHQSFYPDGVYTAGDASVFRHDIAFAKSAGFDFLRIHIKIDDPLLLYYADLLGIMLMVDFPNFGEGGDTNLGRRRFEAMMRAAVERDFNHPSIIAWCLFNETWGFGGQVELIKWMKEYNERANAEPSAPTGEPLESPEPEPAPETAKSAAAAPVAPPAGVPLKINNQDAHIWVQEMWQLAKTLDPTRLIEDMSVVYWEHLNYYAHTDTDINSWHFYINDYAKARAHIEKVAHDTYRGSRFNYIAGYEQGAQPLITSEYGGVGALDGDRDISWSFKFLTNELRRQPKLSAYVFTQLHDVEWEYNGFLNYDRTPKEFGYDPTLINAADVLPVDTAPVRRGEPGEPVRVAVSSSHYGERRDGGVRLQWRLSGMDALGCLHTDLARGSTEIEFPHLRVAPAATVEFALPRETMLCKLSLQAVDGETGRPIAQNYVEYLVSTGDPGAIERLPGRTVLRGLPQDWSAAEWSLGQSDREAARAADSCHGGGPGFFEWALPLEGINWQQVKRVRVLCEVSSRRPDTPQTSLDLYPTTMRVLVDGCLLEVCKIPDHPHDARGVLSYLAGGVGAYGYLFQAVAHDGLLRQIIARGDPNHLRLRFEVPRASLAQNGLTVYGAQAGRYPLGPTVILEH